MTRNAYRRDRLRSSHLRVVQSAPRSMLRLQRELERDITRRKWIRGAAIVIVVAIGLAGIWVLAGAAVALTQAWQ